MFPNGVSIYVDLMQDLIPAMKDGTIRTAIDTGCGVSQNLSSTRPPHQSCVWAETHYLSAGKCAELYNCSRVLFCCVMI